jgi:cob(I)alamin adenosyltransferase
MMVFFCGNSVWCRHSTLKTREKSSGTIFIFQQNGYTSAYGVPPFCAFKGNVSERCLRRGVFQYRIGEDQVKIYTGTGDSGKTGLFSGERLKKNAPRVEAYGCLDELCCFVGAISVSLPESLQQKYIIRDIQMIQNDLFHIGSHLATLPGTANASLLPPLDKARIMWLEDRIDAMEAELSELRSFILPGGHAAAVWSQVARAVCRRAERSILSLTEVEDVVQREEILAYMNRLSDLFFVMARYCNVVTGVPETLWPGPDGG